VRSWERYTIDGWLSNESHCHTSAQSKEDLTQGVCLIPAKEALAHQRQARGCLGNFTNSLTHNFH
jgi:hypothetical protein